MNIQKILPGIGRHQARFILWDDVRSMVDDACNRMLRHGDPHELLDGERAKWVGRRFDNWEHVRSAGTSLWSDGITIIERMLKKLEKTQLPQPVSRKRRPAWSEFDGDEVDMDRLRRGQAYWRTSKRQNTTAPATLTVVADVAALSDVPTENILWRGAGAICLTKLLEAAGYRVELWAVRHSAEAYLGDDATAAAVRLKRHNQPLDIGTVSAAVSGWFFRTVFFAGQHIQGVPQNHYGCSHDVRKYLAHVTNDTAPVVVHGVWDEDAAVAFVRKSLETLTAQGVAK